MLTEKAFLKWLQENKDIKDLKAKVYFEEAPENVKEPFLVLYSISTSQILEIGAAVQRMQLDVFHTDRFKAMELADKLVVLLYHKSFRSEDVFISGLQAQRLAPLKVEDGTYKVPLDIRFICKE